MVYDDNTMRIDQLLTYIIQQHSVSTGETRQFPCFLNHIYIFNTFTFQMKFSKRKHWYYNIDSTRLKTITNSWIMIAECTYWTSLFTVQLPRSSSKHELVGWNSNYQHENYLKSVTVTFLHSTVNCSFRCQCFPVLEIQFFFKLFFYLKFVHINLLRIT